MLCPCVLYSLDPTDHFDAAPERHLRNLLQAHSTGGQGNGNTDAAADAAPAAYSVDYVLTFDSYYEALEGVLHSNHFEQVRMLTTSSAASLCATVAC